VEREQLGRLARVRGARDEARLGSDLEALRRGALRGENLIPLMLEAVRHYATVGEISSALIPVFGTYREVSVL
jgi:methylmalonyl-CoA mutase N-terminal domain/subunit